MTGSAATAVTLPGTTWADGAAMRHAVVRPLNGHDEWYVAATDPLPPARFATLLLGRCVLAPGTAETAAASHSGTDAPGVGPDAVRAPTVGDREALRLHVRALTPGPRIGLVAICQACGEPMGADRDTSDLVTTEPPERGPTHTAGQVEFRLPTGADVEALVDAATTAPHEAAGDLLRRCLIDRDRILASEAEAVARRMSDLDPLAEIVLRSPCPSCSEVAVLVLDVADLLRRELLDRRGDLDVGVHLLALHYHWTEADILDLPITRRRRYVGFLAEALTPAFG